VQERVYDSLLPRLKSAYGSVKVGDPREPGTLIGPLIDGASFERMQQSLKRAASDGGKVFAASACGSTSCPTASM